MARGKPKAEKKSTTEKVQEVLEHQLELIVAIQFEGRLMTPEELDVLKAVVDLEAKMTKSDKSPLKRLKNSSEFLLKSLEDPEETEASEDEAQQD